MPNWVYNKIKFYGDRSRIKELKEFVSSEESPFDFMKIIPMPEELNITSGSDETFAIECALLHKNNGLVTSSKYEESPWAKNKMSFMDWVALGNKYLANKEKYGFSTWYGWCNANWGTKWNASDAWFGEDEASFDTAWSAPMPIFERLTELFPDVAFEVEYADEDLGSNCGTVSWSQEESFVWNPIDDFEFACEVWGYDADEMREEYEDEQEL